uniref:G-protein coupled receptors family 1 profile domain-containing protein n=1 Tax=Anopheles christyi TaxID=43041 RepID=A0A182K9K1_9DIPT
MCIGGKNNLDDSVTLRMHRGKGVASLMESTIRAQNAVRMSLEGSGRGPPPLPPPSQTTQHPPSTDAHNGSASTDDGSGGTSPNPQISISRASSGSVVVLSCPRSTTTTTTTASGLKISLHNHHHHHHHHHYSYHGQQPVGSAVGLPPSTQPSQQSSGGGRHHPPSGSRRKSVFKEAQVGVSRDLSPNSSKKLGKRHLKVQVKRFRMETKAAKTLGIIVGGFIFCWLPFFTMYLTRAFCAECINSLLFSVLFWLGYCNSAVNPFIYALFSKDFRQAFKRIILRCLCSKRLKLNLLLKKNSAHNTTNHSYSPSAFTPIASTLRTEIAESGGVGGVYR